VVVAVLGAGKLSVDGFIGRRYTAGRTAPPLPARRANAAFLGLPRSGNHHDLGLFGVGSSAPPKRQGGVELYHLAWQLDTIEELAQAKQALVEAGGYTGESSHGAPKSVYGADSDGNEFEIL
jgi:hypothetical protein